MKRIVTILAMFFISACDIPRNVHNFINIYYENVYERDFGYYSYPVFKDAMLFSYETEIGYDNVPIANYFLEESGFELSHKGGVVRKFIFTEFYQDKELKCHLFTYSLDELIEMNEDANVRNSVFLVGKEGIRVVSRDEYEHLKLTFQPHPFDPSLCK